MLLILVTRTILLALLVLEWAEDPYRGLTTLSTPYHSQEIVPLARAYQRAIHIELERQYDADLTTPWSPPTVAAPLSHHLSVLANETTAPTDYDFTSMQC